MRVIAAVVCAAVLLFATQASARVWSDATGQNQVEADYVAVKDGNVILRLKATGKLASVPIEKLNEADREYLKSLPPDAGGVLQQSNQEDAQPQPAQVDVSGEDRFSQAIRENPNNPSPYIARAMALTNRGQGEQAMPYLAKALELDPKNAAAHNERGRIFAKQGDAAKAHEEFTKAVELDSKFAPAYRNRADNAADFYKTAEGQQMLKDHESKARAKRDAIAKKYLQKFPWQPPNSTTGKSIESAAIRNIASADYAMAEQLEREVGGGWGGAGGGVALGGGVAVAGPGVVIKAPGEVELNGALEVFPAQVYEGQTVTLVANPSELAKGMPVKIDPKAPRPKAGSAPSGTPLDIDSVDFYRDVNGDGELQKDEDEYLTSDPDGSDGYKAVVETTGFTLGNQVYFAVPKGEAGEGGAAASVGALVLNENLLRATAKAQRAIAEQAKAAAETTGLAADGSDALSKEQLRLAKVVNDVEKDLKTSAPEVADILASARKSIGEASGQLRSAKSNPGAGSKAPLSKACDSAETVASQLDQAAAALAKITGSEGDGSTPPDQPKKPPTPETGAGQPASAAGEILPPPQGAPAPGSGPGPGGPGGSAAPDVVNNYYGSEDDRDAVVDRARDYVDDGDYDRAITEYDRLLRDDPYDVRYLRDRARSYLARGGYDHAIRDYDRAIAIAPKNADFYYNRGCAHQAAGNLDLALADFTMSIRLDELHQLGNLAYNNRGTTYARKAEYALAIEDFNEALKINPEDRLAYHNRALAYKKLGRIEESQADLQRAKELER